MTVAYIRSIPGYLKCIQLVCNMVAFICILASHASPRGDAFLAASIGGFILSLIILIIRVLDLHTKMSMPWMKVEFGLWIIWAIFYLITSALVIDTSYNPYIAGGVFGLLATVAYLIDAVDKYNSGLNSV